LFGAQLFGLFFKELRQEDVAPLEAQEKRDGRGKPSAFGLQFEFGTASRRQSAVSVSMLETASMSEAIDNPRPTPRRPDIAFLFTV